MRALVLLFALLSIMALRPAAAADTSAFSAPVRQATLTTPAKVLPFPRSERAASVWAGDACGRECGSHCAWGMVGCLSHDTQGRCLALVDTCDRYCQGQCRSAGGPLLPIDF